MRDSRLLRLASVAIAALGLAAAGCGGKGAAENNAPAARRARLDRSPLGRGLPGKAGDTDSEESVRAADISKGEASGSVFQEDAAEDPAASPPAFSEPAGGGAPGGPYALLEILQAVESYKAGTPTLDRSGLVARLGEPASEFPDAENPNVVWMTFALSAVGGLRLEVELTNDWVSGSRVGTAGALP